jgi:dCMP deaminase
MISYKRNDSVLLDLARNQSEFSTDPNTKIGCVILTSGNYLVPGFNTIPAPLTGNEKYNGMLDDRESKYKVIVHAEMNAIYFAIRSNIDIRGSTVYVYGLPVCHECAKALISVDVGRVVALVPPRNKKKTENSKWDESCKLASEFFEEAGVEYEINYE